MLNFKSIFWLIITLTFSLQINKILTVSLCNTNLFWFYTVIMPSNCLQLIISDDNILPQCIFDEMLDLQFTHIIRTQQNLMQNNARQNLDSPTFTIHKQCNNLIIFSNKILPLFERSSFPISMRFYPSTDILLISDDVPIFLDKHLNYLNENNIRLLSQHISNKTFSTIKNCLTNATIQIPRNDRNHTKSQHNVLLPLKQIPNSGKPFRISLYNCPPFVDFHWDNNNNLR